MRRSKSLSTEDQSSERFHLFRHLRLILAVGALLATLFTAWTPLGLLPTGLTDLVNLGLGGDDEQTEASWPTPTARPRPLIGIVAGHWGSNDPGAVCPDGLTEQEINLEVATLVKQNLVAEGFDVDLLQEFDERLTDYRALALVSIHADTCQFIDNQSTGFKVAAALATRAKDESDRLVACIQSRYQAATNLTLHAGSITTDMSSYHAFDEIHTDTAAAIIEIGFMNLDRQILTQNPELIARGITDGILCYIYNESITLDQEQ